MRKIKPFIVSWFGIHQVVVASQVVNEDDDEVKVGDHDDKDGPCC